MPRRPCRLRATGTSPPAWGGEGPTAPACASRQWPVSVPPAAHAHPTCVLGRSVHVPILARPRLQPSQLQKLGRFCFQTRTRIQTQGGVPCHCAPRESLVPSGHGVSLGPLQALILPENPQEQPVLIMWG